MSYIPRRYALVKTYTPVLNTKDFLNVFGGDDGCSLPLDTQNLLRALEFIALPDTSVEIIQEHEQQIVEVATEEYPYEGTFFLDRRFLKRKKEDIRPRALFLPSAKEILSSLRSLIGMRYFWGGNCPSVPLMAYLYPPQKSHYRIAPKRLDFEWL